MVIGGPDSKVSGTDGEVAQFAVETEIRPLDEWLGLAEAAGQASGCPPNAWWILPGPARPRIYVPTDPRLWSATLGLLGSPRKKLLTSSLLRCMRIAGRPPHLHGSAGSPLEAWLQKTFPASGPFRFAVYVGTSSIFVKDTVQCMDSGGRVLAYLKVPRGADAPAVVRHEGDVLAELAIRFPGEGFFPSLLGRRDGCFLQSASPPVAPAGQDQGPGSILARLAAGWSVAHPWQESPARHEILRNLETLRTAGEAAWAEPLDQADQLLGHHLGTADIPHPLSHGDFIPWNLRPGPFAFDWEWAAPRLPWHDAFHYLWMPRILKGKRLDLRKLWREWQGPAGQAVRLGKDASATDLLNAMGYLAWQLSFYAGATVRNSQALEDFALLAVLRDLLRQVIAEIPHHRTLPSSTRNL